MAQFKSYARPTGFNPIQVPDETQKYLNQGNNAIRAMQTAAQFDIAEKNRQLQALTKNNDLENANRDFIFQRDMENRQRVQEAILGNYSITARNAETQAANQARFYEQLGQFSSKALEAGTAIYQKVQAAQQERFDKAVYESGADPIKLRAEWTKLGANVSDQAIAENSYFQELIHNNQISTSQIRYLGENLNSSKFTKSRAVQESIGKSVDSFYLENGDTQYDVGLGEPISLNQATESGNIAAQRAVLSRLQTDFYRANEVNQFSTASQQQYINPYIRAAENAWTQRASGIYRQEQAKISAENEFQARQQLVSDNGPQALAQRTASLQGVQRSQSISKDLNFFKTEILSAKDPAEAIARYQQYLDTTTVKNGREMTMAEALAGRAELLDLAETSVAARDRFQQRLIKESQETLIAAQIREAEVLKRGTPQTVEDVQLLYEDLRRIHTGYQSSRLDAILRNETTEAKAVAEMDERLAKLAELELISEDDLAPAPLALKQKYGELVKRITRDRGINGNYKTQMEAIENAVKGIPGVVKGPNSALHWTVGVKISQLQNKFYSRLATLRAAGNEDPSLPTQVLASVVKEFQANPQVSTKAGEFGGFNDILSISGPSGIASARAQHVIGGLERAGKENRTNTFLDSDGAVYTVSELKDIVADSKKPGWKPDALAVEVGRRLGVSPLTVINRQLAARKDPSLPLLELPQPLFQYRQGITPEFRRILETTPTPDISRRAMVSTNAFEPATIPNNLGGMVVTAAQSAGVAPNYIAALAEIESTWNINAVSRTGAIGLMQIQQDAHPGYTGGTNPQANLLYGAQYYAQLLRKYGDPVKAAGAYNSGPGRFDEYLNSGRPLPQETQDHMRKFSKALAKYGDVTQLQSRYTMRNTMQRMGRANFERPSSVVFETSSGQPGVDLYFESKRFPAVLGGVVKDVSREPGYGNYVVVESTDPMTGQKVDVLYGHLADGLGIRPGQRIEAGDIIGTQGGTGNVRSVDGTIASIDFLAPAPRGSKSMKPYQGFDTLRRYVVSQLQR